MTIFDIWLFQIAGLILADPSKSPADIIRENDLELITDEIEIEKLIDDILTANEDKVSKGHGSQGQTVTTYMDWFNDNFKSYTQGLIQKPIGDENHLYCRHFTSYSWLCTYAHQRFKSQHGRLFSGSLCLL